MKCLGFFISKFSDEEYLTQVSRKGTEIRLVRMETLAVVESSYCACYDWKMSHITIRSKTGGADHGYRYDRTVRAGSAGAP